MSLLLFFIGQQSNCRHLLGQGERCSARFWFLRAARVFWDAGQIGFRGQASQQLNRARRVELGDAVPLFRRQGDQHPLVLARDFVAEIVIRDVGFDVVQAVRGAQAALAVTDTSALLAARATQKPIKAALR